jgi:hypothetical protein
LLVLIILSQDLQIFPGAWHPAISNRINKAARAVVESSFVSTSDGETLELWSLPAKEGSSAGKKIAIIFHGNGDIVDDYFPIQKWFSERGYRAYSFDYRGYGRSSGWPSEDGLYRDAEGIWASVKKDNPDLDLPDKDRQTEVLLVGVSIGTGIAAYLASKVSPDTLLLYSPYSSIPEVVGDRKVIGYLRPFLFYEIPTAEYVSTLVDTCLLVIHGDKDRVIGVRHSKLVHDAYVGSYSKLRIVEGAGHNNVFSRSQAFVENALKECPTGVGTPR